MRVIYINLHNNSFILKTMNDKLVKKDVPNRHRCMIEKLLNEGVEVYNVVTDKGVSVLSDKFLRQRKDNSHILIQEAKYILKKNKLERVKCINNLEQIKLTKKDILVLYSFDLQKDIFFALYKRATVILNNTHFYGDIRSALLAKEINPEYYICEVDLKKYSKLFCKSYDWFEGKYLNVPFQFEDRFQCKQEFNKRKNKICAMGNIARIFPISVYKHKEFSRVYHVNCMQPQRKLILEHSKELSSLMDCYSGVSSNEVKTYKIHTYDCGVVKKYKKIYNFYSINRFSKYYRSFDMVEKYNEYKIVVNAEDANGIYAIGAIEAMACGCALIGCDYGAYEDLGMTAGVHYISYDGTIKDLKRKAEYYLSPEHQKDLEKIAKTGSEFVRKNFSEKRVAEKYYQYLYTIYMGTKDNIEK